MCSPGLARGRPRLAGPYRSRDRRGAPNGSVGATVGARLLARGRARSGSPMVRNGALRSARSAFCHASFTVGRRLRAVALSGPACPVVCVSVGKRSAQRPQGAEATGIVTRRAKTAKRASWSRAGRSPARRNRARRPAAGRAVAQTPKNREPRHRPKTEDRNPHANAPGPERRRRDPGRNRPRPGRPASERSRARAAPAARERSERGFCFCCCGGTKRAAGRDSDERLSSGARKERRRACCQASGMLP